MHVFLWSRCFIFPLLLGKVRRVITEAHSISSEPQSIWIRSCLCRTNNTEETFIPPLLPNTSSVYVCLVLPFLHLVKPLLLPPFLSFLCSPSHTLLALHVCVHSQNELLMNLHKGEYQRSLAVTFTLLPRAGETLRHGCVANILSEQTWF